MATVLLNALASTAGGGITYLRNVLPRLAGGLGGHQYIVVAPELEVIPELRGGGSVTVEVVSGQRSLLARWWWEQWQLRRLLRARGLEVLVSLGNFAMLAAPVPQLLFNRNALYFSAEFSADLWRRGCYRELAGHELRRRLARLSIRQAQVNVTPTAAFARQIQAAGLARQRFEVLPFGFDAARFTANPTPLPEAQLAQLDLSPACLRILYVSHYNYFRNFETLLRALPLLKRELLARTGRRLQLVLTTELKRGAVYGGYDATAAAELIEQLGVRDDIAMLGSVPYEQLHQLYRQCDLFVCPSYAESFGHPLVEAMASGVPVAAADLPVHRDVCGAAAVYFDVFDERALAEQCVRVLAEPALHAELCAQGLRRSREFSWDAHCRQLAELITRCIA